MDAQLALLSLITKIKYSYLKRIQAPMERSPSEERIDRRSTSASAIVQATNSDVRMVSIKLGKDAIMDVATMCGSFYSPWTRTISTALRALSVISSNLIPSRLNLVEAPNERIHEGID